MSVVSVAVIGHMLGHTRASVAEHEIEGTTAVFKGVAG